MAMLHYSHETPMNCAGAAGRSPAGQGNGRNLSPRARALWNAAQYVLLLGGLALVWLLMARPAVGIAIMWNILIPAAPALVTILPGLWRNICPMATFSLLPRRLGLSRRAKMPEHLAAWLGLASVIALFAIVPLRHISLNTNGPATAAMLAGAAAIAALMGFLFEWRSGWCTSLCPIHPVEKLYGSAPAVTFKNARCGLCEQCTNPCPDSTPSMTPLSTGPLRLQAGVGEFMAGSFFGFVWGWFQVPDYPGAIGGQEIAAAYLWPFGGALASFAAFKAIRRLLAGHSRSEPHPAAGVRGGGGEHLLLVSHPGADRVRSALGRALGLDRGAARVVPAGVPHGDNRVLLLVPGHPPGEGRELAKAARIRARRLKAPAMAERQMR